MRRAERLFQIIQILRRARGPLTAQAMATELETSKRSVYRDIAALIGQRAPIRGEAGVGYVLDDGFDMPPLMLTADEIEAAVLGAQWVSRRGDPMLARAAQDLLVKIAATVPEHLRPYVLEPATGTPPAFGNTVDGLDLAQVRASIRAGQKIRLSYRDEKEQVTERTVWPVIVGYRDTIRTLMAWCEMRQDFRSFRTDRVTDALFVEERYPERPTRLKARLLVWLASRPMPR